VTRIATTAGMRVDAVAAALAALAVQGLVHQAAQGWAMTTLGRSERHSEPVSGPDELALGWW
jgi:hypothetical protein